MGGYLSTTKSLLVTDYCWHKDYYGHWATASVTVTAGTGGTADYSITVTTSNYNFIQIYLAIDGVAVLNYKDTGGKKTYYYSGSGYIWGGDVSIRLGVGCSQYTDANMSFTEGTLTRTSWSDVTAGSVSITDNYNNTFNIRATKGAAGTNNDLNKNILEWTALRPGSTTSWYTNSSNKYPSEDFTTNSLTKTISLSSLGGLGIEDSRYVSALVTADGARNDADSGWQYVYIKQYVNPGPPGVPTINYSKSRFTIKEPWTITWNAATAGNNTSPIKGYRIRLFKKSPNENTFTTIQMKDINGNVLGNSGADHYFDSNTSTCSLTMDPAKSGILPNDVVYVGMYSYTRQGENNTGTQMFNNEGASTAQVNSDIYTVQNAGVMRPLYNGQYREGQVYAKVTNTGNDSIDWVEADIVKTCVSPNNWVEAE